jgi:hypothetical protein
MSLFDRVNEGVKKGKEIAQRSREIAIRKSERMLRMERLKLEISDLRKEKDNRLKALARKVYELYQKNELTQGDLLSQCQELKTLQWQIDEKWTEVNNMKSDAE